MKKIQPNIDLQNSIECHRILDSNDFYKGKSFNFAGSWTPGLYYHNDEYCVDFVSYNGVMLACKKSHQSHSQTEPTIEWIDSKPVITSNYWNVVMWGAVGPAGETKIPQFKTEVVEGIVKIKYSYDNETWEDAGDIPSGSIRYENELPESGEPGYLYIVYKSDNAAQDQYDEYIWVTVGGEGGHWEKIGGSSSAVTKEDITEIHDNIENIQTTLTNNTNAISTLQNDVADLKSIDHNAYKGYVDTEIDKLSNTYMTEDQVTELIKETVTDTGNIDGGQDSWD